MPALTKSNRVLITSARAEEISYRGVDSTPDNGEEIRDGEFFLTELFRELREGRKLLDAFNLASAKTREYTAGRSNRGPGEGAQNPVLDDPADFAPALVLGLESNAPGGISWFSARPSFVLTGEPAESSNFLYAETATLSRTLDGGDTAWVEIKTPVYNFGELADTRYPELQREAAMVGPIYATAHEDLPGSKVKFSWARADIEAALGQAKDAFITPGTYKVYYFLKDGQTSQVSAYLSANVYVSEPGNQATSAATLTFPADNAEIGATSFFAWTESIDPENDPITYRIELSTDPEFATIDIMQEGITGTFIKLTILQDQTAYHWRVIPVDAFGNSPDNPQVRTVHVDAANPAAPESITGQVIDDTSREEIQGVTVRLLRRSAEVNATQTNRRGEFLFLNVAVNQSYDLEISANGYEPIAIRGLYLSSTGGVDIGKVWLTAIDTGPPEDVNGDGAVNSQDVQIVILGALDIATDGVITDINQDGVTNATDVQLVILAALT